MEKSNLSPQSKLWFQAHAQKIGALIFWALLIVIYQWYAASNGFSPLQVVQQLLDFMKNGAWGVLTYIALYAVRPLILFPSTILTLAGGFVFGPVLGVIYTIVASNISSTIAFFVGYFFGEGLLKDDGSDGLIQKYARRMRENSFETVMIMRFIFLPYDAVSYLAGFLRIHYWAFILATALGSIPGTIAFVGFGASIETFDGVLPKLNPVTLGFSVAVFIVSIALSRIFKKREGPPLSSPHFALNFAQNGGNEGGEHYQTIVIGTGSGGMTAAIGLTGLGRQVAFIEGNHVGGDCTNVGCVPSKTLIHLAKTFKPGMNPDEALREVTRKRDALRDKETEEVKHLKNVTFIEGWAKFTAPKEIEVALKAGGMQKLTADNIVISTGARPRMIEIPGLPKERTLTNESLFDLNKLPKHLVIVGAGVIALEMAFAFQKLGTQVTIFALDSRPLMTAIPEASEAIQAELERKRISTHYRATAQGFDESTRTLTIKKGEQLITLHNVDKVLVAVGRARNLDSLGLEQAGVKVDARRGILVNSFGETNVKGVYAIGDVTPTSAFTHSANAQGRRVIQRIAFPYLPLAKKEPLFPNATFSDPEVAAVGLTEKQLAEYCHPGIIKRIRVDFKDHTDRGYTDGIENGFIIVDAVRLTGQILHATIVGPGASEMISFFTLAISQKISLYKIYRLVYPYPTFSSGILKVTDFFISETLPNLGRELAAYLKYRFAKVN
jgi:dihydrolipoamide dehydrogenase